MASVTQICNRALQIIGERRITSITEDTPQARDLNVAYEPIRDALLRSYYWSFAIKRAQLAASVDAPPFGWNHAFSLPSDCLRLIPDLEIDYIVEAKQILADDSGPLEIRYISRVTDPNQFDPIFAESLSAKLAAELAEVRTQSNSKKEFAEQLFKDKIAEARRVNAFEQPAITPQEDDWVTTRRI